MPATLVTRRPPRPIRVEDSGRWASTYGDSRFEIASGTAGRAIRRRPPRRCVSTWSDRAFRRAAATRCYLDEWPIVTHFR